MIADEWFDKKINKQVTFIVEKYGGSLKEIEKINFIERTVKVYKFITNVLLSMFIIYFFSIMIYERIGFEKTVILIMTIYLLIIKNK